MEYVGTDEDGRTHVGWSQEQNNSCGPACVYMVESNTRGQCLVGGERRIRDLLTNYFNDGLMDRVERWLYDFNERGIGMGKLQDVLRAVGYPCTMSSTLPTSWASVRFPMIAHVAWPSQGGHFIVMNGRTRMGKVVCLDPWYGLQQISTSVMPAYTTVVSRHARGQSAAGGTLSGWNIVLD